MARKTAIGSLLFFALLWAVLIDSSWAAERLIVFADIGPVANLAREVGGQRVEVQVLVPPGRDPHTFEPTPRQMAKLASASLFLGLDLPFARRLLPKLRSTNPKLLIVDVAAGIERITAEAEHGHDEGKGREHQEAEPDPHIWLDPVRASKMAENLAKALCQADPTGQAMYQANLKSTQARLMDIDAKLRSTLQPFRGREFFVFHPALGYLARAYGLKQVAIQAEGKEPGAKRLAQLIQRAKEKNIRIIFVEPQFPRGTAQALAKAIGGAVVVIDPLATDYPANLESMAQSLAQALRQVQP